MKDHAAARLEMVEQQLLSRGIFDARVIEAMNSVPREAFVEEGLEHLAYEDGPLPIGHEQTISQPYVVALMAEAASLQRSDRVLEVGAGSGYAAAVLSLMVGEVFAVERHETLGSQAEARLRALGYDNVTIRVGDGTAGWAEAAPFDAILVAAGAPAVPPALKAQLKIGGRLVIPVDDAPESQSLLKITRVGEDDFREENLGAVRFVPLIGEAGWPGPRGARSLPHMIAEAAEALPSIDEPAFARLFDRFADRRIVLLGEASHGTAEFYRARAAITRHLIERHGFSIVAVEADWPDAAVLNRYIHQRPAPPATEPPFQRFPTWMWRNAEVLELIQWMRRHNASRPDDRDKAGFYGLDMYNLQGSITAVLAYLDDVDPAAAAIARERYGCLNPWQNDPARYGKAVLTQGYRGCEKAVLAQCRELLERQLEHAGRDDTGALDAAQNARLIASAERYYRIMYYGGPESWNLRDSHMFETLEHLLEAGGPDAKAVVWAHNSHIGDARFTDMGIRQGEHNIGQLCRQRFGNEAALVGFGTHSGTVAAASDWDEEMEIKQVQPSQPGSYERLCHDAGIPRFLLDFSTVSEELRSALLKPRLERFIGVIYRPDTELLSHYQKASLPQQFDAYVWFDETQAVTPLGPQHAQDGPPDTFPFGV